MIQNGTQVKPEHGTSHLAQDGRKLLGAWFYHSEQHALPVSVCAGYLVELPSGHVIFGYDADFCNLDGDMPDGSTSKNPLQIFNSLNHAKHWLREHGYFE